MAPGAGISTCSLARNKSGPNTRRIGWEKLPAVYCIVESRPGKPQSQIGARRVTFEAKRWIA